MTAHEIAPRLPVDRPRAVAPVGRPAPSSSPAPSWSSWTSSSSTSRCPRCRADLHAGNGAIEWVVAGYGLTFATLPHHRRPARRPARPPAHVRRSASPLFTRRVGAPAAWPRAPTVLVVARLAQGVAAALLSPQVLSIIGVVYTGADRVRALSVYGIVLGLAAVGGQLIGGVLVQADIAGLGWRSCFLINVPDRRSPRWSSLAPRGARVARRGRQPPGPRRHRADHARPRRHRAAARRGPPARLAGVDVAVPGRRAVHARRRSPPTSGA